MQVSQEQIRRVRRTIWRWYRTHRRDLLWRPPVHPTGVQKLSGKLNAHPWGGRGEIGAYEIMVSELMLQQTQVERVVPYYERFLKRFPTVESLARAELHAVLTLWSGLGYNRRARYLHEAAKMVTLTSGVRGISWPRTVEELQRLPGVGPSVAGMIASAAFDLRVPVVGETNVRQVIHHFFFPSQPLQEEKVYTDIAWRLLPTKVPAREWNYAMFDYGAVVVRPLRPIAKPANQKTSKPANQFVGSNRYWRGEIMRRLLKASGELLVNELLDIPEVEQKIAGLARDQLIVQQGLRVLIK